MKFVVALLVALAAAPATAQAPASDTVPAPERVAAARALLDAVLPPESRAAMIEQMTMAMAANITQSFKGNPQVTAVIDSNPGARASFDRFLTKVGGDTAAYMQANLPGMIDAMGLAYARRFTVAQMAELKAFFDTPTGRLYMAQSGTIMSDPDVARWQQAAMTGAMASAQDNARAFAEELRALPPASAPAK